MAQQNEDEKKTDIFDAASISPYVLTASVIKNNLELHLHDNNTKCEYHTSFTANALQKCGFSNKQVENLNGIKSFITKAEEGHGGLKFSIKIAEDDANDADNATHIEGTHGIITSKAKSDIKQEQNAHVAIMEIVKEDDFFGSMKFTMKLKELPRAQSDINKDHITDLISENIVLKRQVNELREELNKHKMPKGSIIMWSGSTNNVPNGWKLCNGENGTPDLRQRFVIGASNDIAMNSTGGSKTHSHNITVNGHQLTVNEMPSHTHAHENLWMKTGADGGVNYGTSSYGGNAQTSGYIKSTGGNRAHNHTASSSPQNHLPPYYALSFIIKDI
eukprot:199340_1